MSRILRTKIKQSTLCNKVNYFLLKFAAENEVTIDQSGVTFHHLHGNRIGSAIGSAFANGRQIRRPA